MAAMTVSARVDYDPLLVAASVAIAVVASTVALWLLLNLQRSLTRLAASGVMAVAVSGMHYTGMAATRFTMDPTMGNAEHGHISSPIIATGVIIATALVLLIAYAAHVLETRFSQQRMFMAQLEEARSRAEAGSQAKSEFLATMSHEIRTPLNSIIGFTDLLLEDMELNARQRRQIGLVYNSGQALLTIVNDILDFSKVEAGKVELEVEPFAIQILIDNAVSIVQGEADIKGLDLAVTVGPGLGGLYAGDLTRLRQVLLNLLLNAIKFTAAGSVKLNASRRCSASGAELIRFEVTDTGVGVSAQALDRLFKDFSQADASVTRQFGGTGLGLAISKRLVDLMGGEIGVVSDQGSGSTFWFELALPRSIKAPAAFDAPTLSRSSHRTAHILLAEDVAVNQELACAILRREGHQVDVADNGEEALEAVQKTAYDLVLMDIQMPKMDGVTATTTIRQLPAPVGHTPILALTANVLPEQVRVFAAAGMNGHVAKPIKQAELLAAIEKILTPRSADAAPEPDRAASAAPTFDANVFAKLGEILPVERLKFHLETFDTQLRTAFDDTTAGVLKETAHKLVSQAGMFGFMQLAQDCQLLEISCDEGNGVEVRIVEARRNAEPVHQKIGALIASLPG